MSTPKFVAGDRVRIFQKLQDHWNSSGKMDHWLGQVVTIKGIVDCGTIPTYKIEEDVEEWMGYGWVWREDCLELVDGAIEFDKTDLLNILEAT